MKILEICLRKGRFLVSLKRALCETGNYQAYRTKTSSLSNANGGKAVLSIFRKNEEATIMGRHSGIKKKQING